jgi:hypothetical protein
VKITYVGGDLFAAIKNSHDSIIIPHVCNNIGAWGAGFVIPLAKAFPSAREEYLKWYQEGKDFKLGEIQKVILDNHCIINMVAQQGVGGQRPLKYPALGKCIEAVRDVIKSSFVGAIHAPMFGAGLAGGDWNFIEQMIYDGWVGYGIPTTIYYLPGQTPQGWSPPST